jgi:hypothetical protein
MAEETKKPEASKIGLAALIASIGIPLAQLMVGYLQNHTAQLENAILEKERRRLEITKLFLDNYVDKKSDVQIATIQIMKALDPAFFIAIEDGLKETTHSDTVRASIRRATVEAATEISEDNSNYKNQKVKKVLSAKKLEKEGFELLNKGDKKNAQKLFDKANQEYPIYQKLTSSSNSPNGFDSKDMKAMQKKMNKELDKIMDRKMDSLEKASGIKWKRLD